MSKRTTAATVDISPRRHATMVASPKQKQLRTAIRQVGRCLSWVQTAPKLGTGRVDVEIAAVAGRPRGRREDC
jgi:hypothetical protein